MRPSQARKGVVVDGLGVGHAHDRTETAAGGGLQAGVDVFLVFEAGLAQVDVGVHHAGHEDQAAGVHDLAAFGRGVMAGLPYYLHFPHYL